MLPYRVMPDLRPPTASDWGMLVRFSRSQIRDNLTSSALARLLSFGVLEYAEHPPEIPIEKQIENNKATILKIKEQARKLCPKKPNTESLRGLLYKLHEPSIPCKKLQVSAKGWLELKKWNVEPEKAKSCS